MKMFTDCSGECCVCACGDSCLAGHGDDYYSPASKDQLIERLNKGKFSNCRNDMILCLKFRYGYDYDESVI